MSDLNEIRLFRRGNLELKATKILKDYFGIKSPSARLIDDLEVAIETIIVNHGIGQIQESDMKYEKFPTYHEFINEAKGDNEDLTSGVRLKVDFGELKKGELVSVDALAYSNSSDDEEIEITRSNGDKLMVKRELLAVKI